MATSKFRLFAGPNASGKTYLFNKFRDDKIIHTEIYVNADRIEKEIREKRKFSFNAYRVKVSEESFKDHVLKSGLLNKIDDKTFVDQFVIKSGRLSIGKSIEINSYHASFIASYLVEKLFESNQSFALETVMSHPSKVDLLKQAKSLGYKTYFYFVFTNDLNTNLARAGLRVIAGGHFVDSKNILSRAKRVFKLLPKAFNDADSAYIIDNSSEANVILRKESGVLSSQSEIPAIVEKPIKQILMKYSGTLKLL